MTTPVYCDLRPTMCDDCRRPMARYVVDASDDVIDGAINCRFATSVPTGVPSPIPTSESTMIPTSTPTYTPTGVPSPAPTATCGDVGLLMEEWPLTESFETESNGWTGDRPIFNFVPPSPIASVFTETMEEGRKLYSEGKYNEAIVAFTNGLETDDVEEQARLYSNRAACYLQLQKFKEAEEDAESCTALKPTWSKGWVQCRNQV